MDPEFEIESGACFLLAAGILILPLNWLAGAVLAAAIHELCHYLMGKWLGFSCLSLRIGPSGAVMTFAPMDRKQEFLTALAGPVGSFFLWNLVFVYPELAVCGLVQGLFNLLPIWPLDGGRILNCLMGGKAAGIVEKVTVAILLCAGICLVPKWGIYPVLFLAIMTVKAFLRKRPCNANVLGVQ